MEPPLQTVDPPTVEPALLTEMPAGPETNVPAMPAVDNVPVETMEPHIVEPAPLTVTSPVETMDERAPLTEMPAVQMPALLTEMPAGHETNVPVMPAMESAPVETMDPHIVEPAPLTVMPAGPETNVPTEMEEDDPLALSLLDTEDEGNQDVLGRLILPSREEHLPVLDHEAVDEVLAQPAQSGPSSAIAHTAGPSSSSSSTPVQHLTRSKTGRGKAGRMRISADLPKEDVKSSWNIFKLEEKRKYIASAKRSKPTSTGEVRCPKCKNFYSIHTLVEHRMVRCSAGNKYLKWSYYKEHYNDM